MTDNLATDDRKAVALSFMERAARDAFKLCAITAEDLAQQIEAGALPMDGPTACRMLAHMFTVSAGRE
jgi:hypothetical protein